MKELSNYMNMSTRSSLLGASDDIWAFDFLTGNRDEKDFLINLDMWALDKSLEIWRNT